MGGHRILVVGAAGRRDQRAHAVAADSVVGRGLNHERELAVGVEALERLVVREHVLHEAVVHERLQGLLGLEQRVGVAHEQLATHAGALHVGAPARHVAGLVHVEQARLGEQHVGAQLVVDAHVTVVAQDHEHRVVVGAGVFHGLDAALQPPVVLAQRVLHLGRQHAVGVARVVKLGLVREQHVGAHAADDVLVARGVELV